MKNLMQYKCFNGSVEYSEEDKCLFGKIIGISDLISYEGQSLIDLEKDFHESVDDYIDLCTRIGKQPQVNGSKC